METEEKANKGIRPKRVSMMFEKPAKYIPFSPLDMGPKEEQEVMETIRSGWITTGPRTKKFEARLSEYVGAKHAVGTFACTSAMHIALDTLGVGEGDEVVTTPFTFVSTAHVICYQRAKPVFADIDPDTFNIDPEKIEEKLSGRTKGIIPVHYGGHACNMEPILELAQDNGLFVMDDAAHAIGTHYKGKPVGSMGDITCFSFYATKNLSTAEGGMAVTDSEEWAAKMRRLTMYGISDSREIWHKRYTKAGAIHYDVAELGHKCNMTDITAAFGLCQLEKLEGYISTREKFCRIYDRAFKGHPGVTTPAVKDYTRHSRHLYPILLNLDYLKIDRDTFVDKLKSINIGTSVMFVPIHFFTYYAKLMGHKVGDFPIAESVFERVLSLPISPKLGKVKIEKAADGVLYLLEKHKQ